MLNTDLFLQILLWTFLGLQVYYVIFVLLHTISFWVIKQNNINNRKLDSDFFVSVIIAARNEENHIAYLLQGLITQSVPLSSYEIIVINDQSSDNTSKIVEEFQKKYPNQITLLESKPLFEGAYKKQALTQGVKIAKGNILLFTDADCKISFYWIEAMANTFLNKEVNLVLGIVILTGESFFELLQSLEMGALMVITGGGVGLKIPQLANGANYAIRKTIFEQVNGYEGTTERASGDDISILNKVQKKYPYSIRFNAGLNTSVKTHALSNIGLFWQQRIRWAGKNSSTQSITNLLLAIGIWLSYLAWIIVAIIGDFYLLLFITTARFLVDTVAFRAFYYLLPLKTSFISKSLSFVLLFIIYPVYIIFIGIASQIQRHYIWKDRITT